MRGEPSLSRPSGPSRSALSSFQVAQSLMGFSTAMGITPVAFLNRRVHAVQVHVDHVRAPSPRSRATSNVGWKSRSTLTRTCPLSMAQRRAHVVVQREALRGPVQASAQHGHPRGRASPGEASSSRGCTGTSWSWWSSSGGAAGGARPALPGTSSRSWLPSSRTPTWARRRGRPP